MRPARRLAPLLALAWGLASGCQAQAPRSSSPPQSRPGALPPAAPKAPTPEPPATQQAATPLPSATPLLSGDEVLTSLPARLGPWLPPSLVGPQASLIGQAKDEALAQVGSRWEVLANGRILSNNSGSLLSDAGGGIIGHHGAGLRLAPRGLAQAPPTKPASLSDPRMHLWLATSLIHLQDQWLQGFFLSQPKLGEWRSFRLPKLGVLPPPYAALEALSQQDAIVQARQDHRYVGCLQVQGGRWAMRLVLLTPGQSQVAEGRLILWGEGGRGATPRWRARLLPVLEATLGLARQSSVTLLEPDGSLRCELGQAYLPQAQRGFVAQLLTGGVPLLTTWTRLRFTGLGPERQQTMLAQAEWREDKGLTRTQHLIGHAAGGAADLGLALRSRRQFGLQGGGHGPWQGRTFVPGLETPASGPVGYFSLPLEPLVAGEGWGLEAPSALAAWLPAEAELREEEVPDLAGPELDPTELPALAMPALEAEWTRLPGSQGLTE